MKTNYAVKFIGHASSVEFEKLVNDFLANYVDDDKLVDIKYADTDVGWTALIIYKI